MSTRVILCSGCGTKNRLPAEGTGTPRCGGCGKELTVKGYKPRKGQPVAGKNGPAALRWLAAAAVIGLLVWVGSLESTPTPSSSTTTPSSNLVPYTPPDPDEVAMSAPVEDESPAPAPASAYLAALSQSPAASNEPSIVPIRHGVVHASRQAGVAPLAVETKPGDDYYIKVVNAFTGSPVLTAYITGGRHFETDLPIGTYRIKYASGQNWYGERLLFGPDTSYAEADETFNFTFDGSQYSGYTIELIKQLNGNLSTKPIPAASF